MFTELGRVIEKCLSELDEMKTLEASALIPAHVVNRWFDYINGQAKRTERQVFESLGSSDQSTWCKKCGQEHG